MVAYCESKDLVLGPDVPLPPDEHTSRYVQDAADEIDSKLGMRYVTPIIIASAPETRASILLLKRINVWLASGRLLMATTASSESQQIHAYGHELVKQATAALDELASGRVILPGAATIGGAADQGKSGPMVANADAESNVESFYVMTQSPPLPGAWYPPIYPAGTSAPRSPYTW